VSSRGRGSTRTGLGAAVPASAYQPPLPVVDDIDELVVRVNGEDGRSMLLRVDRLPLPGWHRPVAAALAARCGPAGPRRTKTSAEHTWGTLCRLLRFLDTLPNPPSTPGQLTPGHVGAFRRHQAAAGNGDSYGRREMREIGRLLRTPPLHHLVAPQTLDYANQRIREEPSMPQAGYSDRELAALLRAARGDVARIRDRIDAAEKLLADAVARPDALTTAQREHAQVLIGMAGTGVVPKQLPGPGRLGWRERIELASDLFLTLDDVLALLVLFVAVTGRNVETIKELPVEHTVLDGRAVQLRILKRRRGPQRWWQTVTWEIGPADRQLHTPGGLYLLVLRLTARSRAFAGSPMLWGVWRNGHRADATGADEHYNMFGNRLRAALLPERWAARHGLTADPPQPDADGDGPPPEPVPLPVGFKRLRTSIEVRRTRQAGGHLPTAARSNTIPVLFRNYLRGDPTVAAWAEEVVADALIDAEQSALSAHHRALNAAGGGLHVLPGEPDTEGMNRAGIPAVAAQRAARGELDTAWAACVDHDTHPATGKPCRASFLDCFHCGNCLITRAHLPRLLALLDALTARRQQLDEADWWRRYGPTWAAIRHDVLTKFSPAELDQAAAAKPDDALLDLVEPSWQHP
jgi:hypothetical protein